MWHLIHDWLRSGNWAPTFQGVATLAGVFVALMTVIWQIRSSSKHVEDQIKAQRDAEQEERGRRKRAVATAVCYETDGFYLYYLRELRDYLKNFKLEEKMPLPIIKPVAANVFSIYQGNAAKLSELGPEALERVVAFYNAAGRHLSTRAAWRTHVQRILAGQGNSLEQEAARRLAIEIQQALPLQIGLAWLACKRLSEEAKLKFDELAVSKEFESGDQALNLTKSERTP